MILKQTFAPVSHFLIFLAKGGSRQGFLGRVGIPAGAAQ